MEGGRGTTIVSGQAMALKVSVVHLVANASFGQHDTLWHNHQLQGFKCNPHKTRKASDGWASRGDFPRGVRAAGAARKPPRREAGRGGRGDPRARVHGSPAQAELDADPGSHP